MSFRVILRRGEHVFIFEFYTMEEFNSEWPTYKRDGYRPLLSGLGQLVEQMERSQVSASANSHEDDRIPLCKFHKTPLKVSRDGVSYYCSKKYGDGYCKYQTDLNGNELIRSRPKP